MPPAKHQELQGTGSAHSAASCFACALPGFSADWSPFRGGRGWPWLAGDAPILLLTHPLRGIGERVTKANVRKHSRSRYRQFNKGKKLSQGTLHHITSWPRLAGNSGGHRAQALAQAESPTASCPGPHSSSPKAGDSNASLRNLCHGLVALTEKCFLMGSGTSCVPGQTPSASGPALGHRCQEPGSGLPALSRHLNIDKMPP